MIRAITQCVREMINFLIILLTIMAAFGDSFKVMSVSNEKSEQFISGNGNFINNLFYTYLIGLGEFNLDDFGSVGKTWCKVLFFVNTLFTTIIAMNLFIAIISASFEAISSLATQASYREKAGLIAENEFLISVDDKANWCAKGKYLLYVFKLGMNEGEDNVEYRNRLMMEEQTENIKNQVIES